MDCHYRDSFDEQYSLEKGPDVVTLDHYDAWGRTLNHHMARAARHGLIFPREPALRVSLHPLPDGLRMAPEPVVHPLQAMLLEVSIQSVEALKGGDRHQEAAPRVPVNGGDKVGHWGGVKLYHLA